MRFHLTDLRRAFAFVFVVGFAGCATGMGEESCTCSSECAGECVNGRCVPVRDAAGMDAGQSDVALGDAGGLADVPRLDGGAEVDALVVRDSGRDVPLPSDTGVRVDVPTGPCSASGCIGSVLRDGAGSWTAVPADATSAFAPPAPVVAAFDIESLDVAYVLTNTTFHVLRLTDGVYIASGSLSARFPGFTGIVSVATSIPAGHAGGDANLEGVNLATRDLVFSFEYNIETQRFREAADPVPFGDEWLSAFAPDRNVILDAWLALENDDGWVPGSPRLSCGANGDAFVVYLAFLADDQVYIYDAGHCFDFVARIPAASFAPFQRSNAPDFASIGGSFYHQGDLWFINTRTR